MPSSFLAAPPRLAPARRQPRLFGLVLALLGCRLVGAGATFDLPHPTVITTDIDGVPAPVIGAQKKGAVVRCKDGTRKVGNDVPFKFNRAWRFAPGSVTVSEETALSSTVKMSANYVGMGSSDMGVTYSAKLTTSTTYPKCYAVLIFANRAFLEGESDQPATGIFFKDLGTLEAHRPTGVSFNLDWDQIPASIRPQLTYFLLVFTDGAEIRTDRELRPALFFRRLELEAFKKAMTAYLEQYAAADHELKIFLSVPPYLPDAAGQAPLPASVKVSFIVTPEGTVDSFALADPLPAAAAEAVQRSVSAWLFLPRLENGMPQPTAVHTSVPLGVAGRGKG